MQMPNPITSYYRKRAKGSHRCSVTLVSVYTSEFATVTDGVHAFGYHVRKQR